MPRTRRTLVACGVALLVLAGCTGGDDKEAAPATSAPAATGPTTTARPVDTSFTGQDSAQFCAQARTYTERFASLGANTTPGGLRTSVQEGQAAIREVQRLAPAEVKNDVDVLVNAFGAFLSEVEKVDFDANRVPPAALGQLQTPEFQAATTRFEAYLRSVCGLGR